MRSRPLALATGVLIAALMPVSTPPVWRSTAPLPVTLSAQAAPSCGCPPMPIVATSKEPAKGSAALELRNTDLEAIFSNRHIRYAGGWTDAFVALAREIDPGGAMKIWSGPPPAAVRQAPLIEGGLSGALLNPAMLRPGVRPPAPAIGSNPWSRHYDGGSVMSALVHTLARIDKYGEPAAGLRTGALAAARFLLDDLSRIPQDVQRQNPRAAAAAAISGQARAYLRGVLGSVSPAELAGRARNAPPGVNPFLERSASPLPLDLFDVANAALDVLWSADPSGAQTLTSGAGVASDLGDELSVFEALIRVAAGAQRFGGPAPAGSAQDAVACRAFSTLATFADVTAPASRPLRDRLANGYLEQVGDIGTPQADPAMLNMTRTAVVMTGVDTPGEVQVRLAPLFEIAFGLGRTGPDTAKLDEVATMLAALSKEAGGIGRDTRRQQIADAIGQRIDGLQQRRRARTGSPEESRFLDRWSQGANPVALAEISGPCGVGPATQKSQIILYAVCATGLQVIKEIYVGVPTVIEAQFDPPSGEGEVSLNLSIGGRMTTIKVHRYDPRGYIYRSDPFLPVGGSR